MSGIINPFAHDAGGGTDPSFASVIGLWHFNNSGLNNGHGLTPVTLTGTGSYSSTQSKFGGFSLSTGTNGGCQPGNATWVTGTGDYTIEGFFWLPSVNAVSGSGQALIDFRSSEPQIRPDIIVASPSGGGNGSINFYLNGAFRITSAGGVLTASTWNYFALSRNSGTTRLWYGTTGTCSQAGSNYTDANNYTGADPNFGRTFGAAVPMVNGYLDEIRITQGVGRYATAPTVPIAAFPNSEEGNMIIGTGLVGVLV
jgi:hypothetical protein